jgi:uncharacterized membrane protein YkvA (DUF1232 family)
MIAQWKQRAEQIKNETLALALALKDRRTPLGAKIMAGITVSYALSPIDIIPDFIPVLGYLDDLIIIPILIIISLKLIPRDVLEDCRSRVKKGETFSKKIGWFAAITILLFWVAIIVAIVIKLL